MLHEVERGLVKMEYVDINVKEDYLLFEGLENWDSSSFSLWPQLCSGLTLFCYCWVCSSFPWVLNGLLLAVMNHSDLLLSAVLSVFCWLSSVVQMQNWRERKCVRRRSFLYLVGMYSVLPHSCGLQVCGRLECKECCE